MEVSSSVSGLYIKIRVLMLCAAQRQNSSTFHCALHLMCGREQINSVSCSAAYTQTTGLFS